jgi:hypothetical protein
MSQVSVVCCVNRFDVFEDCVLGSLPRAGMAGRVEVISIDNTSNRYSAPQALNLGIDKAQTPIVVCCHQDVRLPDGWLDRFISQIARVEEFDKQWGVAGVMGVGFSGAFAGHIVDPHTNRPFGKLPKAVQSLDEVLLVVRQENRLRFDEDLGGFHFYGADLCLQARMRGIRCYALDTPVEHLSGGVASDSFYEMADRLCAKWRAVPGAPWVVETTCGVFGIRQGMGGTLATSFVQVRRKCWRRLQGRAR